MTEEKILTLHPDKSKTGRNIDQAKYDAIKNAMLEVLGSSQLSHNELMEGMNNKLKGKFDGNIGWYAETVKLDLEARNSIRRSADKPARYGVVK